MELSFPVFAIICSIVAHSRGRSFVGWFFIGLFFSCLGLVLLLVLPDLGREAVEQDQRDQELRRLREQLKRDRARTDERFGETARRLDHHDEHLGLDTRTPPPLPGPLAALPAGHPLLEVEWWYAQPGDDRHVGPVAAAEFSRLIGRGEVRSETLVWCDALGDWTEARAVSELAEYFHA